MAVVAALLAAVGTDNGRYVSARMRANVLMC